MLSVYWADPHKKEHEKWWITKHIDNYNRWFNGRAVRSGGVISWALDRRASMVVVALGSLVAAFAIPGGGILHFVVIAVGLGFLATAFGVPDWSLRRARVPARGLMWLAAAVVAFLLVPGVPKE